MVPLYGNEYHNGLPYTVITDKLPSLSNVRFVTGPTALVVHLVSSPFITRSSPLGFKTSWCILVYGYSINLFA